MPSTRKQKAKERHSRHLDIMSDVENVDIMLKSYSRDEERNDQSESEFNLDSGSIRPQQSITLVGEDFRSLLNTNCRKNSELTSETTRMINEKVSNQVSRKLHEIKSSLNSQNQDAITTAITEKVLPSIQNTLDAQGRANFTVVDRGSNGLQQNLEVGNTKKTWQNRPKTCFEQDICGRMSRQSSVDSYNSEQNCDTSP